MRGVVRTRCESARLARARYLRVVSCADCELTEFCRCVRVRMAKAGIREPACLPLQRAPIASSELLRATNVVLADRLLRGELFGTKR